MVKGIVRTSANQLWVSDITYIQLANGDVAYLHLVTDAYSRKIVGWVLADTLRAALSIQALQMAIDQAIEMKGGESPKGLIHHSDRGSQYVSIRYSERLAEAGIEPSVGSKGDSYDNALAETINGLYKAEVIHRRSWPTRESVELATLEWVSWFNHHRLLGPIGYIPPAEAEANYYRQLASQSSMVAA